MAPVEKNVTPAEGARDPGPLWLRFMVVILGLAILFMVILIVVKLARGDGAEEPDALPLAPENVGTAVHAAPALSARTADIARPENSRLVAAIASGTVLTLHFTGDDGDWVVLVDTVSGVEQRYRIPASAR